VGSADVQAVDRGLPKTEMGWEIDPQACTTSSNGSTASTDRSRSTSPRTAPPSPTGPGPDGTVADPQRVSYLEDHFRIARRAIDDGIDLRGYFVWSSARQLRMGLGLLQGGSV
jgi:beta-glucosidase